MIHIRTHKRWKFREDPDGNAVRELPPDRTYSFEDDDIGLIAIAEGAAEPVIDLTEAQTQRLEIIRAAVAGDEALVGHLLAQQAVSGADAADRGDGTFDATSTAPAPVRRSRKVI